MTDDRFTIDAKVSGRLIADRIIAIETTIAGEFYSRLFDTEDKLIREGLIRLGWTPPEDKSPEVAIEGRPSAGPFTAGRCQVYDETPGVYDGAAVFDSTGEPFALIPDDLAIGGHPGARARATRIAEALNK